MKTNAWTVCAQQSFCARFSAPSGNAENVYGFVMSAIITVADFFFIIITALFIILKNLICRRIMTDAQPGLSCC